MTVIDSTLKKDMLLKQPVFKQLKPEEIEILSSLLIEKKIASGETIVKEGDLVDSVYLIVSGKADVRHVYIEDDVEKIQHLATLNEGEAIGLNETGFYSLSGVRTATVVAETPMELLYLSVAAFHGFALAYSHVNEVMRKQARNILNLK